MVGTGQETGANRELNNAPCPICRQREQRPLFTCRDELLSHEEFALSQCTTCGLIQTVRPPLPEQIGVYYQSPDYISHSDNKKGLVPRLYRLSRRYMLAKKAKIIRQVCGGVRPQTVLDIGAGTGHFAAYMSSRGAEVVAVEPAEKARNQISKHFGLPTYTCIAEIPEEQYRQHFDVITLWHVLEHLYEPQEQIARLLPFLKPGGVLVLALPNVESFDARKYKQHWAAYDVPRHLWHFSSQTVKDLVQPLGLTWVKTVPMYLDAFYIAYMSEQNRSRHRMASWIYLLKGVLVGMVAWGRTLFRKEEASSLIYFWRKS